MRETNIFLGFIFMILGGVSIVRPDISFKLRAWMAQKFWGMKIKASKVTYNRYKILGVFYFLIGLAIMIS